MTAPDRFKEGYASAERHWKNRWHAANDDLQKAISENERLHARLAAVEALAVDLASRPTIQTTHGYFASRLRAALETDTTKETP